MPVSTLLRLVLLSSLFHAYIGFRLLPDLPIGTGGIIAGTGWLVLSSILSPAPFLMRGLKGRQSKDLLAWMGYLSMGLFSSLFVLTVLRDLVLLAGFVLSSITGSRMFVAGLAKSSAIFVVIATGLVTLIGIFNARRLAKVVDVEVPIENLPEALSGFTIVQISDVHVGSTIKRGYLDAIVGAVNRLTPDLIAVTGDMVDGSVAQLGAHVAPLAKLSARHGVYLVTGNHEYYSGAESWIAEFRRLGLQVMMNESRVVEHAGARLLVAGVTDYSAYNFDKAQRSDPGAALRGLSGPVAVKVLLAHQPRSSTAAAEAGFDLQLSGHTHGGQFLPWNFFVRLQQPFTAGLHRLKNLWVYTSRGTGYWGPPIRFGAPSEITRLRLVVQTEPELEFAREFGTDPLT